MADESFPYVSGVYVGRLKPGRNRAAFHDDDFAALLHDGKNQFFGFTDFKKVAENENFSFFGTDQIKAPRGDKIGVMSPREKEVAFSVLNMKVTGTPIVIQERFVTFLEWAEIFLRNKVFTKPDTKNVVARAAMKREEALSKLNVIVPEKEKKKSPVKENLDKGKKTGGIKTKGKKVEVKPLTLEQSLKEAKEKSSSPKEDSKNATKNSEKAGGSSTTGAIGEKVPSPASFVEVENNTKTRNITIADLTELDKDITKECEVMDILDVSSETFHKTRRMLHEAVATVMAQSKIIDRNEREKHLDKKADAGVIVEAVKTVLKDHASSGPTLEQIEVVVKKIVDARSPSPDQIASIVEVKVAEAVSKSHFKQRSDQLLDVVSETLRVSQDSRTTILASLTDLTELVMNLETVSVFPAPPKEDEGRRDDLAQSEEKRRPEDEAVRQGAPGGSGCRDIVDSGLHGTEEVEIVGESAGPSTQMKTGIHPIRVILSNHNKPAFCPSEGGAGHEDVVTPIFNRHLPPPSHKPANLVTSLLPSYSALPENSELGVRVDTRGDGAERARSRSPQGRGGRQGHGAWERRRSSGHGAGPGETWGQGSQDRDSRWDSQLSRRREYEGGRNQEVGRSREVRRDQEPRRDLEGRRSQEARWDQEDRRDRGGRRSQEPRRDLPERSPRRRGGRIGESPGVQSQESVSDRRQGSQYVRSQETQSSRTQVTREDRSQDHLYGRSKEPRQAGFEDRRGSAGGYQEVRGVFKSPVKQDNSQLIGLPVPEYREDRAKEEKSWASSKDVSPRRRPPVSEYREEKTDEKYRGDRTEEKKGWASDQDNAPVKESVVSEYREERTEEKEESRTVRMESPVVKRQLFKNFFID